MSTHLAFIKNYDFIFALHYLRYDSKLDRIKFNAHIKKFAYYWNELRNQEEIEGTKSPEKTLSAVSDIMVEILQGQTQAYWMSQDTVTKVLLRDKPKVLKRIPKIIKEFNKQIKKDSEFGTETEAKILAKLYNYRQ